MIRMSLQALLSSSMDTVPSSELVSEALTNAIRHLDESIRSDIFDFLPYDRLCELSPDQLRDYIQRHKSEWEIISERCTQGATVIFSLLDPSKRNLWVVNLGDSQAGMRLSPFRDSFAFSHLLDDSAWQKVGIWRMVGIHCQLPAQRQQPAGMSTCHARASGRTHMYLRQQGHWLPCTHTR